jgi:hypothetical protein
VRLGRHGQRHLARTLSDSEDVGIACPGELTYAHLSKLRKSRVQDPLEQRRAVVGDSVFPYDRPGWQDQFSWLDCCHVITVFKSVKERIRIKARKALKGERFWQRRWKVLLHGGAPVCSASASACFFHRLVYNDGGGYKCDSESMSSKPREYSVIRHLSKHAKFEQPAHGKHPADLLMQEGQRMQHAPIAIYVRARERC